jgi:hypothetical protein
MEHPVNHKTALIVALLVLAFAISVLVTAYDSLIECIVQLKSLTSSGQGSLFAFSFTKPGEKVIKELKGILWIGFILITLYLGGFLAGIPVYVFAFLRLSAGRSYKQSLLLSAGATGFIYLLFIELLQYRLYQGLIFG